MRKNNNVANNGGKWITPKRRHAIYERDDHCCVYCGIEIPEGLMTLDHLHPQELGGTNATKNLVTCCKTCNSKKGSKSVRQFLAWLRNKGVDTDGLAYKIRKHVARKVKVGRI